MTISPISPLSPLGPMPLVKPCFELGITPSSRRRKLHLGRADFGGEQLLECRVLEAFPDGRVTARLFITFGLN